jgi:alanine dehydrogenase
LTNATLPYAVKLANYGWVKACQDNEDLKCGLNIIQGQVVYKAVADAFNLPFTPIGQFL